MNLFRRYNNRSNERGQILPMFAVFLVVMILFIGLAIDLGYAYVTKANLSKAVDAAALKGMLSYSAGSGQATLVAASVFAANYQSSGRDTSPPVLQACEGPGPNCVYFTTNSTTGLKQINVTATTTINTFFARIVPSLSTLTVSDTAQSTRANVMMTLVLDHSGSMQNNDGWAALPPAVNTFLTYFSDTLDQVAVASFSTNATLNVPMQNNFTSTIDNTVNSWGMSYFQGATFALGGMQLAQAQEAPSPANVLKVVVFFTDGIANTIQDNLNCTGYPNPSGAPEVNYGGNAPTENDYIVWADPLSGNILQNNACYISDSGNSGQTSPCCSARTFPSQQYGTQESYTRANITAEAEYRTLQIANALRAANPPVVIYTIGLGSVTNPTFLQELANSTNSPTYNSALPSGLAVAAPYCPGPTCITDLQQAFQQVATDILLKLTQ